MGKNKSAAVKLAESDLNTEETKLSQFKEVFADLVYLRERVAHPEPVEEPDEKMEAAMPESINESIEKVSEMGKQPEVTTADIKKTVSMEAPPCATMTMVAGA